MNEYKQKYDKVIKDLKFYLHERRRDKETQKIRDEMSRNPINERECRLYHLKMIGIDNIRENYKSSKVHYDELCRQREENLNRCNEDIELYNDMLERESRGEKVITDEYWSKYYDIEMERYKGFKYRDLKPLKPRFASALRKKGIEYNGW